MSFVVIPRSSGGGNLHQSNGDPISTPQSHKPCPNGSAPDVDGKCQTTVCPNGSAPDVDGNCTRHPSIPRPPSSSLENNRDKILSQPSQLLPSSPTTTCPDGSSPDTNGNCTPYPLPSDPLFW